MKPDVWVVWPTVHKEQSNKMISLWHELEYKVAILVNQPLGNKDFPEAEMVIVQDEWKGFPVAANILCEEALGNIIVVVGDDVYPDKREANKLGERFLKRFPDTFGVAQPTADKYGCWDKCAVSPWIGRKFIKKIGPYCEQYYHYFSDEDLQQVAMKLNVFEQWEDVNQYHDHWERNKKEKRPAHLLEAKKQWHKDRKIFKERMIKGFPNES